MALTPYLADPQTVETLQRRLEVVEQALQKLSGEHARLLRLFDDRNPRPRFPPPEGPTLKTA